MCSRVATKLGMKKDGLGEVVGHVTGGSVCFDQVKHDLEIVTDCFSLFVCVCVCVCLLCM